MDNVYTIIILRITQCIRSTETVLLFSAAIMITVLLSNSLLQKTEEEKHITIGFYYDNESDFNRQIFENISANAVFNVEKCELIKGRNMIDSGEIAALFVLNNNALEMIDKGETTGIVEVYYNEQNPLSLLAQDVFAAELLKEIAVLRAASYYMEAKGDKSVADYKRAYNYGKELGKIDKQGYYIKFEEYNSKGDKNQSNIDKIKKIGLDDLRKQVGFGIILTLISFLFLFLGLISIKEKQWNIYERITLSKLKRIQIIIGEYLSMLFMGGIFSLIIFIYTKAYSSENQMSFTMFAIMIMFIISQAAIIELWSSIASNIYVYIMGGSLLILIMAIISGSFFPASLVPRMLKDFLANIPYTKSNVQFSEAIISGNIIDLNGYFLHSIFIAVFFILASAIIDYAKLRA